MARSKWKAPYIKNTLYSKFKNSEKNTIIQTKSRASVILPGFVGRIFDVYNGCRYTRIYIEENMVGLKLGSFSFTRKLGKIHMSKENK
jgi:small subunit ribosomal protein S19